MSSFKKSKPILINNSNSDNDNNDNNDNSDENEDLGDICELNNIKYDSKLNYSIYSEKVNNKISLGSSPDINPISKIYPKTNDKWVESSYIYQCQLCDSKFSILLRKHHCRSCGGVFCYRCCSKYIVIPQKLLKLPDKDNSYRSIISTSYRWLFNKNMQLVCNVCESNIVMLKEIEPLLQIFYYFDLKTLYNISSISKAYNRASQYYMTKFRDIQYKKTIDAYDSWEREIIFNTKEYLINHSIWFVVLIKTIYSYTSKTFNLDRLLWLDKVIQDINNNYNNFKHIKCWNLLCSRKCTNNLESDDILNTLLFISTINNADIVHNNIWNNKYNKNIIINLTNILTKKSQKKQYIYIPLLVNIFSNLFKNEYLTLDVEFLINILNTIIFSSCNTKIQENILNDVNIKILCLLLFEKFYIEDISNIKNNMFLKYLMSYIHNNQEFTNILNNTLNSVLLINDLLNMNNDINIINNITKPTIYPLNPNYLITKINKRTILKSNTKPILIEAEITQYIDNNVNNKILKQKNVKFIIKKDKSLRKEQLISSLIDILQHKISTYNFEDENVDFNNFELVPTYQIIMITKDVGLIEYIEDSITLRMINQHGYTLQNYILNCNANDTLDKIKTRFMHSLSISSCISYIIGLGDRHLDNIIINKNGQIFHIDYGYIMENPLTTLFDMPQIKVTSDIIDFLGGPHSIYYNNFKMLVIKIYNILRANRSILNMYFKFICDSGYMNWDVVENKLNQKLMNGMKCKDIEITLVNEIESANSFTNMFVDICHMYKQKLF